MRQETQGNELLKGALIGGVLGGVAALLLAQKTGKDLRERFESMTARNVPSFEGNGNGNMLIGGAIGAIIGAIAAHIIAPHAKEKLRAILGDTYDDLREKAEQYIAAASEKGQDTLENLGDWKDTLTTLFNKLTASKKGKSQFELDELLNWAGLALSLYRQYQKRRG